MSQRSEYAIAWWVAFSRRSLTSSYGSTSSTNWTPASSSGGRPAASHLDDPLHPGLRYNGHASSVEKWSRTYAMSCAVVAGTIGRPSYWEGDDVFDPFRQLSVARRGVCEESRLRDVPISRDVVARHDRKRPDPARPARSSASVTMPNIVRGARSPFRSAAISSSVRSNCPVSGGCCSRLR